MTRRGRPGGWQAQVDALHRQTGAEAHQPVWAHAPGDAVLLELARAGYDAVSPTSAADVCVMHEAAHERPGARPDPLDRP